MESRNRKSEVESGTLKMESLRNILKITTDLKHSTTNRNQSFQRKGKNLMEFFRTKGKREWSGGKRFCKRNNPKPSKKKVDDYRITNTGHLE